MQATQANGTQPQLNGLGYLAVVYQIDQTYKTDDTNPKDKRPLRPGYWGNKKPITVAEAVRRLPPAVRERMAEADPSRLIPRLEEARTYDGLVFLRRTLLDLGIHPNVALYHATRIVQAVQLSEPLEGGLEKAVAKAREAMRDWLKEPASLQGIF